MASAIIGVGLLGAALRSKATVDFDELPELALADAWVGKTMVIREGPKFSSRTLEFADDGTVQPNFPFENDLVPRTDNHYFL